jgi:hypothetical protein
MNKNLISILAGFILVSPWIYIGSTLKDVIYIVFSVIIILATVDISRKKKTDVI